MAPCSEINHLPLRISVLEKSCLFLCLSLKTGTLLTSSHLSPRLWSWNSLLDLPELYLICQGLFQPPGMQFCVPRAWLLSASISSHWASVRLLSVSGWHPNTAFSDITFCFPECLSATSTGLLLCQLELLCKKFVAKSTQKAAVLLAYLDSWNLPGPSSLFFECRKCNRSSGFLKRKCRAWNQAI